MQKLVDKGDWEAAENALESVFQLAPDCIDALNLSARLRLHDGDYEGAVMDTGRVLKISQGHVEALLLRGKAHFLLQVCNPVHYLMAQGNPSAASVICLFIDTVGHFVTTRPAVHIPVRPDRYVLSIAMCVGPRVS